MKKQNVRTLSLIVGTFTYLLIGAAIFDAIESEEERRHKEALENLEAQMLRKYDINQDDFNILEEVVQLQQPYKAGKPWKFAGSFYYATTVLTTIGYGHSTPKTNGGKIFTMIYAIIGIPIGLVMFNSIGERFNYFASIVINKIRKMVKAKQQETTEMDLIGLGTSLSIIVFTAGAAAFSHYEGWSYYHSMYYCFITLTTIGFGDFVALQQDNALEKKPEYVTFALFFIMFGLAIIAALLNLMVLKFMTMNTEDEKRDEAQAIQNAAQTVRLDGDIICQHNELQNQADTTGSFDDVRSVCSCTALTCDPFHIKAKNRLKRQSRDTLNTDDIEASTRCSTTMKWYSTDSLHTAHRSPIFVPESCCSNSDVINDNGHVQTKKNLVIIHQKNHSKNPNEAKAGSIHDLRRCAVSNLLKVPPQYTTFESTQRMPLHVTVNTKHKHFRQDTSDEVMVIQTDVVRNVDDDDPRNLYNHTTADTPERPTSMVLVNGILPGKSHWAKLVHWTKCFTSKTRSNIDDRSEHLPLEEMGRSHPNQHQDRLTQKRVSF